MLYTTLHHAGLSAHLEEGSSWSIEKPKSRPADILVANWDRGFSAAFDVSVTSPLNPLHIVEVGISPGAAAKATEERKHRNNDAKCEELGWRCIPMVVESYGCWGTEARQALSQLASQMAVRTNTYKSQMLNSLYGRLNLTLIRCNARAILSRSHFTSCVAAHKAECRKHSSNDPKCQELGWVCVPLAVESYGNWGKETQNTFATWPFTSPP
ncbi:hypothetical protein EMCRGX_G024328 [Ephydatia muelleri]